MGTTLKVIHALKRFILTHDKEPTSVEVVRNWEVIERRYARIKRRRRNLVISGAAAAAMIPVGMWLLLSEQSGSHSSRENIEVYALRTQPSYGVNGASEVTIVMPDGSEVQARSEEAIVNHDADGNLSLNHERVAVSRDDDDDYNQLIVPYGCRSDLTLSDGSRIWINSNSRVVYPAKFEGERREIYLDGEAYLEVKTDKTMPFIVKTARMNVEVTGTKFNVFAYPCEKQSEVALAEGAVSVSNASSRQKLVPGQLISADRSGVLSAPHNGDVASRISWTKNLLVVDNESIETVLKRLNLYYGKRFDTDTDLSGIYLSGKLDMSGGLESILSSISFFLPIIFEEDGDSKYIVHYH